MIIVPFSSKLRSANTSTHLNSIKSKQMIVGQVVKSVRILSALYYKSFSMYRHKVIDVDSPLFPNLDQLPESIMSDAESRIGFMEQNKIDCSIIRCVFSTPVDDASCKLINEHLSEACVNSEGRLFGLATIQSSDPARSEDEMKEVSKLEGIKGFVLNCEEIANRVEGYKASYLLLQIAQNLSMPIILESTNGGLGDLQSNMLLLTCVQNMITDGIFDYYPDLKVVVTGNGMFLPYLISQLENFNPSKSLQKQPIENYVKKNIFFITNHTSGKFLDYLLETAGNNNLLFGSPDTSDVEEYNFGQSQLTKQKICGLNAATIFNLDPAYKPFNLDMKNINVVSSPSVTLLSSKLRDKSTDYHDYMIYGDRLMTILAEEALAAVPSVVRDTIETPTGTFEGLADEGAQLCVVSIVRSGDILLESIRKLVPGIRVGKILIQRDETTEDKRPILFYEKLPSDISKCYVLLVDPMVATAGSMLTATDVLVKKGVNPDNMMFVNLFSCEEGLATIQSKYPDLKIITLAIDDYMNSDKYIVPGVGDFGDRYYGTNH